MTNRRQYRHAPFLGSEAARASLGRARYVVLPVPYERTTTYGKGTARGPAAILSASEQVELFIDELGTEPSAAGIFTAPPLRFPASLSPERCMTEITRTVERLVDQRKFVICLGGEHTITVGAATPFIERYPDLTLVQVDAHADLRDSYEGSELNHACTMRRIIDRCHTLQVGIRSLSAAEAELVRQRKLQVCWARDIREQEDWARQVAAKTKRQVYLSIDVDALDPSIMPSTGTPEPGGLDWWEMISLVREISKRSTLVGADITELAPCASNLAPDFTAAKLVYHIIGYAELKQRKVGKR